MHGNDTTAASLEQVARCSVRTSVSRAAQLAAVAGYVARARAELGPPPDDRHGLEALDHADAEQAVVSELAARLVITEAAADREVFLALTLTTRLPVTFDALVRGVIDEARAKVVAYETELLSDAHAAVVDEAIAPVLGPLNTAELTQQVKAEVEDVDREAVKRRVKKATADRHTRLKALADGMAELTIRGPATEVVPAYNNIEALAKDRSRPGGRVDPHAGLLHDGEPPRGPDGVPLDQRSMNAHRTDTALALLRQGLGDASPSGCGPQIFVAFSAAVGLDDQPAQMDRTGSLPPVLARELLTNHRFRRVFIDPLTGHLVAVDGHSYPPGTLPDLSRPAPGDGDGPFPPPDGNGPEGDSPDDSGPDDSSPDGGGRDSSEHRGRPGDDGPDHGRPGDGHPDDSLSEGSTPGGADRGSPGDGGSRSAANRGLSEREPMVPPHAAPLLPPASTGTPPARPTATPAPAARTVTPTPTPAAAPTPTPPPEAGTADESAERDGGAPAPAAHRPCPVAAAGGGPYDMAAAILRFVRARTRRCSAPGCRRPSRQCDTDHRIPWPKGPTCPCNLAPLCRRHHLAKHRFGWDVQKANADPADPSQRWTSPLGYEYVVPAEPLLPEARSSALARERGVPSESWPEDDLDARHPYERQDWLGRTNTEEMAAALESHARAHAPEPDRAPTWSGRYADDPPF